MTMAVKEVIYDKMQPGQRARRLHVHDKRVDLKDVFFNLFGGSVTMAVAYDTKNPRSPRST
jgi:hypothetical protein